MGLIAGLLTIFFAFTHERLWPSGAIWIAAASLVTLLLSMLMLSCPEALVDADRFPITWR